MIKITPQPIINRQQNSKGKLSKKKKVQNKGYMRASFVQGLVAMPLAATTSPITRLMYKNSNLNPEQLEVVKPIISDTVQKIGLADKGVKTLFVETYKKGQEKLPAEVFGIKFDDLMQAIAPKDGDSRFVAAGKNKLSKYVRKYAQLIETALNPTEQDQKLIDIMKENAKAQQNKSLSNILMKKMLKTEAENILKPEEQKALDNIKNIGILPSISSYKFGNNIAYTFNTKTIVMPDNKLTLSAFHEIGHAINANKGKIGSLLQNIRPFCSYLPVLISLIALTNPRKNNDEQAPNDSIVQKGKDFVKRNAGKLTFAASLPIIAEEALATIRGNKIAKSSLPQELYKRVKTSNALAFSTYIFSGIIAGLGIAAAVKVKDKIQANYEHKLELKAQKKALKAENKAFLKAEKKLSAQKNIPLTK